MWSFGVLAIIVSAVISITESRRLFHGGSTTSALFKLRGGASDESEIGDKVKGTCIGIDLGTTYSCVAVWKNGRVEVCPNEQGNRITPSYVAWGLDGQRLCGDSAKNQASSNPTNTVFDVKR